MPLDAHLAAAHRVAPDHAVTRENVRAAGETKAVLEMPFVLGARREKFHALDDFDHALLALALLLTGCGYRHAETIRIVEERWPRFGWDRLAVDDEIDRHGAILPCGGSFKFGLQLLGDVLS